MVAVQAVGLGLAVGAAFGLAGLPVPAPQTAAGVAGIVGLFAGWVVATRLRG